MRGHFSIEWMAQSSLSEEPGNPSIPAPSTAVGPGTAGTHCETLPGFYCRPRAMAPPPGPQASSKPSLLVREAGNFTQETSHKSSSPPQAANTETGFSSSTEEETSGYESEGGRSLCSSSTSSSSSSPAPAPQTQGLLPPPSPQNRRPRTAFTAEQVHSLERAFKRNAYLGTQDKAQLCRKLNLSDKQIRNWFQNRRMKLKRTVQDALAHACQAHAVASQFLHYPELPGYRPAPYPRFPASPPSQDLQSATVGQRLPHPYAHPTTTTTTAAASTMDSGFYHPQYHTLPAGVVLPPAGYLGPFSAQQHY